MFKPASLLFLLATLFSGLAYAFMFPLTGLYLVNNLGASPFMMGLFLSLMMLSGIGVSTWIGKKSDQGWSRRSIITLAQLAFIGTNLCFVVSDNYWLSLLVAVLVMCFSSASMPQLFTLGRLYADRHLSHQSGLFVSLMRAAIAVAWVVGPPMAFIVEARFGVSTAFLIAAVTGALVLGIALLLPIDPVATQEGEATDEAPAKGSWLKQPVILLFLLSCIAMFAANNMYLVSLPLYLTKELQLGSQWAGYMMGLAAAIEIPIMVLAGMFGPKLGNRKLILIAIASGGAFYFGITQVQSITALLLLQALNGLFIGITATLGMLMIQDLMKSAIGLATTLFSNAQQVSLLFGNLMTGILAQLFSYYSVFWFCTGLMVVAFTLLALAKAKEEPVPTATA